MKTPLLVINFKAYERGIGERALALAKAAEEISDRLGVSIAVCPHFLDLREIRKSVRIPILAQHMDPIEGPGSHTGSITAHSLKLAGVNGTILNHSERRISFEKLKSCIKVARKFGLLTIACAKDVDEARQIAGLEPNFIAIEPPELIGGEISVSQAKPEVITRGVAAVKEVSLKIKILCGAGIKRREDVSKAISLGSEGILVASGIVKAANQRKAIEELARGLKE